MCMPSRATSLAARSQVLRLQGAAKSSYDKIDEYWSQAELIDRQFRGQALQTFVTEVVVHLAVEESSLKECCKLVKDCDIEDVRAHRDAVVKLQDPRKILLGDEMHLWRSGGPKMMRRRARGLEKRTLQHGLPSMQYLVPVDRQLV